jgi:hypothetical protein
MLPVETFEHIVRKQDLHTLVAFLLKLEKADAMAVRLRTKQFYREMNNWDASKPQLPRDREPFLFLAGLATYSKQEALGRSFNFPWNFNYDNDKDNRGHKDLFNQVLRHSRPSWLTDWLERITRSNSWQVIDYGQLRELAEEGLVEYNPWLFAQALAHRLNRYSQNQSGRGKDFGTHVLRQLQANKLLLERDVPLLFDFDTSVDSAAIYLGDKQEDVTWLSLLTKLAESGHLDRADLLTRSLMALRRDFRRPLLSWFRNLFLALQPSAAERLSRQTDLLELLAHPLPLVVNFAIDQLKEFWTQPDFQVDALLRYTDGLLTRQDLKTGVKTLLSGFSKILKAAPAQAPVLAPLYAAALAHADADVQSRAAKGLAEILKAKKPLLPTEQAEEISATIASYSDLLTPDARTTLAPWLSPAPTAADNDVTAAYTPVADFAPDISAATAITPVADWHDLLFLTGQVLKYDDPAALERWLDGLLRLRTQFPAAFVQQLGPYLRQAFPWILQDKTEEEVLRMLAQFRFGENDSRQHQLVQALLLSWLTGFASPKVPQVSFVTHRYSNPDPLLQVEQQRLMAAEAQLHPAASALPLLSTPTHAPYWVAPTVLIQKLLAYEATGQLPDAADLAVALARTAFQAEADAADARLALPRLQHEGLRNLLTWFLAPASPDKVPLPLPPLATAGKSVGQLLSEVLGRLVRFQRPSVPVLPAPSRDMLPWLWAVAVRTRYPGSEVAELRELADYPGVAAPWQPGWHFEQKSNLIKQPWNKQKPEYTNTWQELCVPTEQQGQVPPSGLLLYSVHARLQQKSPYYLWSLGPSLPFLLAMVPNNPAPLHWHLLRTACRTDEQGSEGRNIMQVFLNSLLSPGPTLADSTTVLLAVGLTHAAPVCRALALEVLLSVVEQRRLVCPDLGQALGRLLAAEFVPIQRLSDQLAQARAINPLTDDALRQILEALLPALPGATPLRNTRKLLDAYADLLGRNRQLVPPTVQERLNEWQATASLKKVAASLLA